MALLAEVAQAGPHAALVVEDDLAGRGHAGKRVAHGDGRHLAGDRRPAAGGGADRHDDEAVDALVDEPLGQLELARGLAVGVGHERRALGHPQLALDGPDELLVPEVGQAAHEQADHGGVAAGQRAGDRVGLVAELGRGGADTFHGLGRHLAAPQRVGDRGR